MDWNLLEHEHKNNDHMVALSAPYILVVPLCSMAANELLEIKNRKSGIKTSLVGTKKTPTRRKKKQKQLTSLTNTFPNDFRLLVPLTQQWVMSFNTPPTARCIVSQFVGGELETLVVFPVSACQCSGVLPCCWNSRVLLLSQWPLRVTGA